MSPAQLKAARKKLGLSADELAKLVGVSSRSMTRYESGRRETPYAIGLLLSLAMRFKAVRRDLGIAFERDLPD